MAINLQSIAVFVLLLVCVYSLNQNRTLRKNVDNIERFLVTRDKNDQQKQVQVKQRQESSSDVDDDDDMARFDNDNADGLKAPPRGYSPQVDKHTVQQKNQKVQSYEVDDDTDAYADELCNAPLLGSK